MKERDRMEKDIKSFLLLNGEKRVCLLTYKKKKNLFLIPKNLTLRHLPESQLVERISVNFSHSLP